MSISVADALRLATVKYNQRKQKQEKQMYTLHFTNSGTVAEGCIHGRKKAIVEEFLRTKNNYKYAFITKKGNDEVLYVFNRGWGTKFMTMRDKKPSVRKK